MIIIVLIALQIWILQTVAIQPIRSASFVEEKSTFKVAKIATCPKEFTLLQNRNKITTQQLVSKGASAVSSSNISISLDTGIFLLNSDTNYEAFYLDVTIEDSKYPLLIDTASPYVWVYGEGCNSTGCEGKQLYSPSSSTSETQTFDLAYSSSTASGYIADVNLTINDALSVQHFNIGVAQSVPDIFEDYNITGVIGLPSNDDTSLNGLQNLVEVLYDSESIDDELFTVTLNNGSSNYDGLFTIGKIIPELYQGNISYTDVIDNDQSYWKMEITNVFINDYQVTFQNEQKIDGQLTNDSRLAIVDSGTTIMVLNKKDASTLHSFFNNSISDGTNFAIYCNETKLIDLEIGDLNFTIDSTSYIGTAYPKSSKYNGYCVSNFQGLDVDDDGSWILGGLFLKTVYSVFDYERQRIGFAYKNSNDVDFKTIAAATSTVVNNNNTSSTAYLSSSSSSSSTATAIVHKSSSFANSTTSITQNGGSSSSFRSIASSSSFSSNNNSKNTSTSKLSANVAGIGMNNSAVFSFISFIVAVLLI